MKRKNKMKRRFVTQQWTPFQKCERLTRYAARQNIINAKVGPIDEEKMERLIDDLCDCTTYVNNLYTVAVYDAKQFVEGIGIIHLSLKRNDRAPITNWNHLQRIKNELVGPEHEAVELFPAESRLVNMANQYHLWVLANPDARFPFGFHEGRNVSDQIAGSKAKQNLEKT